MIPHNRPSISYKEKNIAKKVLNSGNLSTDYQNKLFEKELSRFMKINKENVIVCSSGSAALYLALWAINAQNKSVAYPSYVCSAVRNAVNMMNSKHEIIDISSESCPNINEETINKTKSKICIVPHMYGIPIKLGNIKNKIIIEDCCQSLGAKINKKNIGLQGDISILSFYTTKLITSGGHGGAVFSHNVKLIKKIRDFLEFDQRRDNQFRFNFKMNEINAAIGREQLKRFNSFLLRRNKIFREYRLTGHNFLDVSDKNNINPVRYRAIILMKNPKKLINYLKRKKIIAINPLKDWEILGKPKDFPNSLEFSKKTVSIPIYPSLKDYEYKYIAKCLKDY